jgi:2-polyprenyl-6-methoxyphenol hydroxylase-like FAD-dependent oxidoreductase
VKAIVVGGGIAGLAAAIALRKVGYDISVHERARAYAPMGAALSLWGNAMAALDWLGVADRIADSAAAIEQVGAFDRHGRALLSVDVARSYGPLLPVPRLATRSLLQAALLDGLDKGDLHFGQTLTTITQSPDGVDARFDDGSGVAADLAVVADGIWSPTASALLGTEPTHQRYGGVLALSDSAPDLCPAGSANEYWGRGERFGVFDLGGARTYWFYMRNEADPVESKTLRLADIAARAGDWPASIARVIAATPTDRLIPFSIFAKPPPRRLGQGRIICIGDAAHAMQPNLGQGGCQALEDAVALGCAAAHHAPDRLLPVFERLRVARVATFVNRSATPAFVAQSRQYALARLARGVMNLVPNRLFESSFATLHHLPDYASRAR